MVSRCAQRRRHVVHVLVHVQQLIPTVLGSTPGFTVTLPSGLI
jgi:hypothetical protein